MQFARILTALAVLASASAWKIPRNSDDGVYSVKTLSNGTVIHTKIIDAASIDQYQPEAQSITPVSESNALLDKRGADGEIWCGCGFTLDTGNCDAAVAALKDQFFASVHPGESYYSIRGPVVAFVCNRGNINWSVFPNMVTAALSTVTSSCGRYISGARQYGDDSQALLVGYQRWGGNDDFCGNARSSPAHSC